MPTAENRDRSGGGKVPPTDHPGSAGRCREATRKRARFGPVGDSIPAGGPSIGDQFGGASSSVGALETCIAATRQPSGSRWIVIDARRWKVTESPLTESVME